ncbi:MAG: aminopeptidase N [Rhodospirillaceae bacterium]
MTPDDSSAIKTIRLADYAPPAYGIRTVELTFDLLPSATRVTSRLAIERRSTSPQPLALNGEGLKLLRIAVDGKPLPSSAYQLTESGLTLLEPPAAFVLETEVEIDPEANKALEGLYRSQGVFCTQCEAEGFRHITYYLDRPDVMATFRTTIRAPKKDCPVLLANGNPMETGDLPDGRHYAVWDDPHPKPCYLFALVAGDLAHIEDWFTTASNRKVRLRIYVEHGKAARARYAMESLIRSMEWDEVAFGREYDLDVFNIVAVSDFNMGAMENKGLNVFNDRYILADSDTATDLDYYLIESIVGHEYFHNWSGNRVTCRDWFQLSLKEGLTVFRDQEFTADMRSRANKRIDDVETLRTSQFREDASPLAHPVRPDSYVEINNFYTATVYQKGAEVIRMMHTLLGAKAFRAGMDLYFERHDGQAVTCDDFAKAMEDASGRDLSQFKLWYSQAGTPRISVEDHYDAETKTLKLTVRQSCPPTPGQPEKKPYHIPFALGVIGDDGRDLASKVLELRKAEEAFEFTGIDAARPRLSLNRAFSAPVIVDRKEAEEDLAFRMAQDTDSFNRWNAAQDFACSVILSGVSAALEGGTPKISPLFLSAVGAIAQNDTLEPAFKASALGLPAEDYLANRMSQESPLQLHQVRKQVRRAIAEAHAADFRRIYDSQRVNAPYVPDAAGMGRRMLKRTALGYIGALETSDSVALVKAQFDGADNMTDRMDALAILNQVDVEEREAALTAFYDRFKNDHLVVNKWLSVQAMCPLPGTLTTVRKLLSHPSFDLKNPNKLRAVIGVFSLSNPANFHAADGSGYEFLAEQVLAIDKFNPQVAARLVPPLGRWRRFDPTRQALMKAQLERLASAAQISRDVGELVTKSLRD